LTLGEKHGEICNFSLSSLLAGNFERMPMKSNYLKHIALLLTMLSLAGSALAQYVWLDEHGVKQFSDIAPPANVPQNRILKQPHRATETTAGSAAAADATADDAASSKGPMTAAELNAAYNKRKQDEAEKAKKAEAETKKQAAKADNCARATNYLTTLNSGVRVSTTDANGQRSYLSDDERAKEQAQTQSMVDTNCQ
jgi:hypothetical protein